MKIGRRWILGIAVLVPLFVFANTTGDQEEKTVRWVIASSGSALARDGSKITLTGSGTFVLGDPEEVTSAGTTWTTFNPAGGVTGSGTYQVTSLVKFDQGSPFPPSGLAFLRITYSDGNRGILVVSCRTAASPPSIAEGISASKGVTNYWNGFRDGAFFQLVPEAED